MHEKKETFSCGMREWTYPSPASEEVAKVFIRFSVSPFSLILTTMYTYE